jgi:copper chaperone CopZ
MQKIFFIALSLSLMLGLSVNAQSACCKKKISKMEAVDIEQESPVKHAPKQENTETVKLKITGLTCAGCSSQLHKLLNETKGVVDNSVEYPGDIAVIQYNPDQTSPELIMVAIKENTSYTAELLKEEGPKKNKSASSNAPKIVNV